MCHISPVCPWKIRWFSTSQVLLVCLFGKSWCRFRGTLRISLGSSSIESSEDGIFSPGISPAGPWHQHKNRGQPTRRQTASCQCPFSSNPINAQVEQHFSERPTKFSVRSIWFQHVWKVYPCNYQLSEIYMAFAGGSRLIKTQSYAARWPHCLWALLTGNHCAKRTYRRVR